MEIFINKDGLMDIKNIKYEDTVDDLINEYEKFYTKTLNCAKCREKCCEMPDIKADNVFYKQDLYWEKGIEILHKRRKEIVLSSRLYLKKFFDLKEIKNKNWENLMKQHDFKRLFPTDYLDEDYYYEEANFYLFMPYTENGYCAYFDEETGKCEIYEIRPLVCRFYTCKHEKSSTLSFISRSLVNLYSEAARYEVYYKQKKRMPHYWNGVNPAIWEKDYSLPIYIVIEWAKLNSFLSEHFHKTPSF